MGLLARLHDVFDFGRLRGELKVVEFGVSFFDRTNCGPVWSAFLQARRPQLVEVYLGKDLISQLAAAETRKDMMMKFCDAVATRTHWDVQPEHIEMLRAEFNALWTLKDEVACLLKIPKWDESIRQRLKGAVSPKCLQSS